MVYNLVVIHPLLFLRIAPYSEEANVIDVTSEKHLNPFGSAVHGAIVGLITVLFGVTTAVLYANGDLSNPRVHGSIGWAIFGMIVSFVFTLNELSHIHKGKSRK